MDAIAFFKLRYRDLHVLLLDDVLAGLTEAQVRSRPQPAVNTVAWLLWHSARIEDVGVNRFIADRPQVLDGGWQDRLGVERRDVGTGMDDRDVDELSRSIDLDALRGYWEAVTRATLAVVESLPGTDLEATVSPERVKRVAFSEGAVDGRAAWLADFWAGGRSRAWFLAQVPLLHVYGHWFEARVTKGLWGIRSP